MDALLHQFSQGIIYEAMAGDPVKPGKAGRHNAHRVMAALAGAERESMSLATEAELLNEVRNAGRGLAWAI